MATFTCPVCSVRDLPRTTPLTPFQKTVYFAERQMRDGKGYHPHCLQRFMKDSAKGSHASQYAALRT